MPTQAAEIVKLQIPLMSRSLALRLPHNWIKGFEENAAALLAIATSYDATRQRIDTDENLTLKGRFADAQRAALSTLEELRTFEAERVDTLGKRIEEEARNLLGLARTKRPTDLAERLAYELRAREIRDELRKLDSLQRLNAYYAATDPAVLDAIETAPPVAERLADRLASSKQAPVLVPFVDPSAVERSLLERARRAAPQQVEELDGLRLLREAYGALVGGIRTAILQDVPSARPDPVADLARATQVAG